MNSFLKKNEKEENLAIYHNITDLEDITLTEIRQSQKDKYRMIPLI